MASHIRESLGPKLVNAGSVLAEHATYTAEAFNQTGEATTLDRLLLAIPKAVSLAGRVITPKQVETPDLQ